MPTAESSTASKTAKRVQAAQALTTIAAKHQFRVTEATLSALQNGTMVVESLVLYPLRQRTVLAPDPFFAEFVGDCWVRCFDALSAYGARLKEMTPINYALLVEKRERQVLVTDSALERAYYNALAADPNLIGRIVEVLLRKSNEDVGNARRRCRNIGAGVPVVRYVKDKIRDGLFHELLASQIAGRKGALTPDGWRLRDQWSIASGLAMAARASIESPGFTEDEAGAACRDRAFAALDAWHRDISERCQSLKRENVLPVGRDSDAGLKKLGAVLDTALDVNYKAQSFAELGHDPRQFADGFFDGDRFVPIAEPAARKLLAAPQRSMEEFRL